MTGTSDKHCNNNRDKLCFQVRSQMLSINIKRPLKLIITHIRMLSAVLIRTNGHILVVRLYTLYHCSCFAVIIKPQMSTERGVLPEKSIRKCNDFCVVHLLYSNSRRHSNDSMIASPRRHIDIHRKWEHEIIVVLGNTAAMETGGIIAQNNVLSHIWWWILLCLHF